jgi:dihydropteroate synthase
MVKNTPFRGNYLLQCKGRLLDLSLPKVMGILNMTEDSFYAGSRIRNEPELLQKASLMLEEGAMILDIGGQSTRPGSARMSESEEKTRVTSAVRAVLKNFPDAILSVDTYSAAVAAAAIQAGAAIINDISAGEMDASMIPLAGSLRVPYIAMHMKGEPAHMQENPRYEDILQEILDFFIRKSDECRRAGIRDLIIDPGFGFGKTTAHNYTLLRNLSLFAILDKPLMIGISRKSMVYKPAGSYPEEALTGTTALHMLALQGGVNLLRVHDVRAACDTIRLFQYYKEQA